ncbi:unnamed protein product, partial [Heterosigma akashiwo]
MVSDVFQCFPPCKSDAYCNEHDVCRGYWSSLRTVYWQFDSCFFDIMGHSSVWCAFFRISWVVWKITDDPSWMVQNAVGFSGIIFTLAVVESYRSLTPTRSIFGFVQVPTRIYPWALMIVLQVMVPQISFMGHFSGLLVGIFYSYNCL